MAEKIDRAGKLIDATRQVIEEEGIKGVTYRKVAKRAGESLGLASYYFPTLHSLLEATMRKTMELQLAGARKYFTAHIDDDPATVLTEWFGSRIAELEDVRGGYELYLAAVTIPELRPIATEWFNGFVKAIDIVVQNEPASYMIDAIMDASFLRYILGGPDEFVDLEVIKGTIRQIIEGTDKPQPGQT